MSAIHVDAQEISYLYTYTSCVSAACAILVYDWLLCLGQEVRFIWSWHSKVNGSSLVYAFSRYAFLIQFVLAVATSFPMSDMSCKANAWIQTVLLLTGTIASSVFSALRAYALSNRNIWLTTIIILFALPPTAMSILQGVHQAPTNLPSPFNCSISTSLSHTFSLSVFVVWRGSQLTAELLVIGITWWYTYHSYHIQKGINLGKTISSLLIYNGTIYFLFLSTLCILDIIFSTAAVPDAVWDAGSFMEEFYYPVTSILTCRFILSLRQFDSTIAPAGYSDGTGSRVREHMAASMVLEFGAQRSGSLPSFIASFAHPIHVDSVLSGMDTNAIVEDSDGSEWREMDAMAPTLQTPSGQSPGAPGPSQPSPALEHST